MRKVPLKGECSSESAREITEGSRVEVTFELSLEEDGGLYRWEGWSGEGAQEEGQGESRFRADGVLRRQWLGAWNVGAAVIQGAGVWWSREARLSRWVGGTWT